LPLPEHGDCRRREGLDPLALPDGRLGLLYLCERFQPDQDQFIEAYDPATGSFDTLFELTTIYVTSGQFTVSPTLDAAVIAYGDQICQGVARYGPSGREPLAVTIGDGRASFRLDDPIKAGDNCRDTGRANYPDISPDGSTLALFASPGSIGSEGQARLDAPWSLYLIDLATLAPTAIVGGVHNARGLRWSGDGTELGFSGKIDGVPGTWSVAASGGRPERISEIAFDWWALSPDGQALVGTDGGFDEQGERLYRLMIQPLN
jgi:hypothetical protein